jgi:hypothetical protein
MEVIAAIATPLLIHLGKVTIDRFWGTQSQGNSAVVNQTGSLEYTASDAGRTQVRKDFTVPTYQRYEVLFGDLYLDDTVRELLSGDEIPLVAIVEENQQQVLLFDTDLDGYEVDLPQGVYSICVFLVDADASTLFDSQVYAIGFPSAIDLSDAGGGFELDYYEDVWQIIDSSPVEIKEGGPYYLDFVVVDTTRLAENPLYFADLME